LCGQVKTLCQDHPEIEPYYRELQQLADRKTRLTESKKRRMVHELRNLLDTIMFSEHRSLMDRNQHV
jgi:hypothetical protein